MPAVCEGSDWLEGCHVPLYRGLSAAVLGTVSLIGGLGLLLHNRTGPCSVLGTWLHPPVSWLHQSDRNGGMVSVTTKETM